MSSRGLPLLAWRVGEVADIIRETPTVASLVIDVPGWPGHLAGQHVDVRLTADDGYQAQRSYSIASPPEERRVSITVERLDDGEVSPYLVGELHAKDKLELRGPIGGYFVWRAGGSRPLLLIAGGSGVVPLMAMIRHRAAVKDSTPVRLLYSSRAFDDVIYREELDRLAAADQSLDVRHTLTRAQPPGWKGYARRLDRQMIDDVAWPTPATPLVFLRPDFFRGSGRRSSRRARVRPVVDQDRALRRHRRMSEMRETADMKVDGNAIGGLLGEIFAMEMTVAESTCGGCGAINAIGRVDVYMNAPGAVVRCPSCEQVLMRIVRGPQRYWLDLSGIRCLELRPA